VPKSLFLWLSIRALNVLSARHRITLKIFKVAFSIPSAVHPYDVKPSGARHKPSNLT